MYTYTYKYMYTYKYTDTDTYTYPDKDKYTYINDLFDKKQKHQKYRRVTQNKGFGTPQNSPLRVPEPSQTGVQNMSHHPSPPTKKKKSAFPGT